MSLLRRTLKSYAENFISIQLENIEKCDLNNRFQALRVTDEHCAPFLQLRVHNFQYI